MRARQSGFQWLDCHSETPGLLDHLQPAVRYTRGGTSSLIAEDIRQLVRPTGADTSFGWCQQRARGILRLRKSHNRWQCERTVSLFAAFLEEACQRIDWASNGRFKHQVS